ncbi:MAG: hypothetical protein LBT09_13035 [Planctomycetaceae bacterium]|jgi:hypothetical protein|nr:hypothetical protein [Planctomycetaceae bacterium]
MSTLEELCIKAEKKGREEERVECKIETVIRVLKARFKKVPAKIIKAVRSYKDPIALNLLIRRAAVCDTLLEFERDLARC